MCFQFINYAKNVKHFYHFKTRIHKRASIKKTKKGRFMVTTSDNSLLTALARRCGNALPATDRKASTDAYLYTINSLPTYISKPVMENSQSGITYKAIS